MIGRDASASQGSWAASRAESILIEYQDASGDSHQERMNGYLARVVQHECDHLEGTIFLDRMTSMDSITTIANYAQFHAPGRDTGIGAGGAKVAAGDE